jgi:outer membrane protein OmpA-like peptidoglycan-associated protein
MLRQGCKLVSVDTRRRWGTALAIGLGFLASGPLLASSNSELLGQLENTWPDASLEVELLTEDNSSSVVAEDPVRYRLTAQHAGACYLVHVDAEDNASLLRPEDCSSLQPGQSSHFPSAGTLEASAPWGEERVFAFLLNEPLPQAEKLLDGTQGFVPLNDESALADLIGALQRESSAGQLAVAKTDYDVMQYRTRGIIRAVKEAREDEDKQISFSAQSINFEFGSDELTESGQRQLDEFGKALADPELVTASLEVAGHTDDIGEETFNLQLSERRAKTVGSYLQENFQISEDRVKVVGFGESSPLVPEKTRAARAQNRRVEMIILE